MPFNNEEVTYPADVVFDGEADDVNAHHDAQHQHDQTAHHADAFL